MTIYTHYFYIEEQANVVYMPYRPNGFAVILLSDNERTVGADTSIWQQHPERYSFLKALVEEGYTVITSQLFGKHWGSDRACQYIEQLHHFLIKKQILNKKFHLFAEGIGALVALRLIEKRKDLIRSVFLLNPCIYVETVYNEEKKNKLFFKRFLQEFSLAHQIPEDKITEHFCSQLINLENWQGSLPIHIYHLMADKKYPVAQHSRRFEQFCVANELPISLSIYGLGKSFSSFLQPVRSFYKKHEKKL
ncbi:alpha/beta hydrolase [Alkalihalobacillus sp. 1P02AB]|uniref:alpha/beta hydrolase n=1 Tax=Alkalihalobacillus sp. 1P02AB TaxID=3132260 RepID=UPI0039A55C0A